MSVVVLTEQNFEAEVLQADGPVLVDFWAEWCMPCKMQGPAIDKLAAEGYPVGKVNVDEEGSLAGAYGVMSIPTLIIFKRGEMLWREVGIRQAHLLEHVLEKYY